MNDTIEILKKIQDKLYELRLKVEEDIHDVENQIWVLLAEEEQKLDDMLEYEYQKDLKSKENK